MSAIAASFTWPFRGPWRGRWAIGLIVVVLLPLLFVPLLGYAIAAVRAAELEPLAGPPPWRLTPRLLYEGAVTAVAIAITAAPFVLLSGPVSAALTGAGLDPTYARVIGFFVPLLGWGLVVLLLMPHSVARFASTSRYRELFDVAASVRGVGRDFARWNVVAAAIVTAWAIGLACAGLLCVGLVPGVFYAILVSAHAAATLHPQAGVEGPRLPAR